MYHIDNDAFRCILKIERAGELSSIARNASERQQRRVGPRLLEQGGAGGAKFLHLTAHVKGRKTGFPLKGTIRPTQAKHGQATLNTYLFQIYKGCPLFDQLTKNELKWSEPIPKQPRINMSFQPKPSWRVDSVVAILSEIESKHKLSFQVEQMTTPGDACETTFTFVKYEDEKSIEKITNFFK